MALPLYDLWHSHAVDAALDSEVLKAFSLTATNEVFAHHAARHPLGHGFSGSQDLIPHAMKRADGALSVRGVK